MCRAVGAGVHVDELITRMWLEVATALLQGSKAGGSKSRAAHERRHYPPQESLHAFRVRFEYRQGSGNDRRICLQSGQPVRVGVVADVFAQQVLRDVAPE